MTDLHIEPSSLQGTLAIPPSKSQTLRAILFAALAKGTSQIDQILLSPDTEAMIKAVGQLGAHVTYRGKDSVGVVGTGGRLKAPEEAIDCGNSGIVLRFIGALVSLLPHSTILTGDASIRHLRHVKPLLEGLRQLGCEAVSTLGNERPPLLLKGPWLHPFARIEGRDSQPVSGLLIAAAFAPHPVTLQVTHPGETAWIDLTLSWLKRLNIPYKASAYCDYQIQGNSQIDPFSYRVSGDFSTAAFPAAAALITRSPLTLTQLDWSDPQGDKIFFSWLEQMGAKLEIRGDSLTLFPSRLKGITVDIDRAIDALPILATLACFAESPTEIVNGAIARRKESDRIAAISQELKKMGAHIVERSDGLLIHPSPLRGTRLFSHLDHRIAMSLSVASLGASGNSVVEQVDCIEKTYPNFAHAFQTLGARFHPSLRI